MSSFSVGPRRLRRVGPGVDSDTTPLLDNNGKDGGSKNGCHTILWVVAALAGAIAIAALGVAIAAYVKSPPAHTHAPAPFPTSLTLENLTVTHNLNLSSIPNMQFLSPSWFVPGGLGAPAIRSANSKRTDIVYDIVPGNTAIVLGNPAARVDARMPNALQQYVAKDYYIYSNTSFAHTLNITALPGTVPCGAAYQETTWDQDRRFTVARFDATPGCYLFFKVVDCGTIMTIASRCVDFCTNDLSHCEHPHISLNATWADIAAAKIGTLNADSISVTNLQVTNFTVENVVVVTTENVTTLNAESIATNVLTAVSGAFTGVITAVSGVFTNVHAQMLSTAVNTITVSGELPPTYNTHLINGGAAALNTTLPADMTAYVGKRVKVCSTGNRQDTLSLAPGLKWDSNGYWNTWRAEPNAKGSCCLTFDVVAPTRAEITERACGLLCTNSSLVHCIDPLRPEATNPLHGWWRTATKSFDLVSQHGFSYRFINMTVSPPTMRHLGGHVLNPRLWQPEELAGVYGSTDPRLDAGEYIIPVFAVSPTILSEFNTNNLVDPAETLFSYLLRHHSLENGLLVTRLPLSFKDALIFSERTTEALIPPIVSYELGTTDVTRGPYDPRELLRQQAHFIFHSTTTAINPSRASFTATLVGTTLTVTAVAGGRLHAEQTIYHASVSPGTRIVKALTGTGLTGTYQVSSPPIASITTAARMSAEERDQLFIGYENSVALLETMIGTGFTHSTAVISVKKSPVAAEGLTSFRFADFPYVEPVGLVSFTGFTGDWAVLNTGKYQVFGPETTVNIAPDPLFEDYHPTNASRRTTHHTVTIWFNSTALSASPALDGNQKIVAAYGPITPITSYIDTVAAQFYWMHNSFKIEQHYSQMTAIDRRTRIAAGPSGIFLGKSIEKWVDLQNQLATLTNTFTTTLSRVSGHASIFYPNPRLGIYTSGGVVRAGVSSDFTGDKNIRPEAISLTTTNPWFYNINIENYLTDVVYPTWRVIGNNRTHSFNTIASLFYPGGGGDEFNFTLVPYNSLPPASYSFLSNDAPINGPAPFFPTRATYASISPNTIALYKSIIYAGKINSLYSGTNQTIGYIRISQFTTFDLLTFIQSLAKDDIFKKTGTTSTSYGQAPLVQYFAQIMQYLKGTLGCTQIIIDIRGNTGGSAYQHIQDFFGSTNVETHHLFPGFYARTAPEHGYHIYPAGLKPRPTTNQQLVEANYPGSTFTSGTVVIVTDTTAVSGSDHFVNMFLGPNNDKQLGSNTTVKFFGNMDGRLSASACFGAKSTVSKSSPRFFSGSTGRPVSIGPIANIPCGHITRRPNNSTISNRHPYMAIDCPPAYFNGGASPAGLAGGCPMVADWENLVYPDIGVSPNVRPVLPGWTGPQTPLVLTPTNVLSTTNGSNVATVTLGSAHGLTTGNSIGVTDVLVSVGGIPAASLIIGTTITVTGANTFTYVAGASATSTVASAGGTIRILVRSHWRDAWLEQAITALAAIPPGAPSSRRRLAEDPEIAERLRRHQREVEAERETASRNHKSTREHYGRDVSCPPDAMPIEAMQTPMYTDIVLDDTINPNAPNTGESIMTVMRIAGVIRKEMQNGGMCLDANNQLKVTPLCQSMPHILLKSEMAAAAAETQ